jgi:DNA-binding IclR family transcriptional regulator
LTLETRRSYLAPKEERMPDGLQTTASIARGLEILRAFASDQDWLGNQELAELTGLPKSTVSRATNTLVAAGFLESGEGQQKFRLGPAVLLLAGRVTGLEAVRVALRPLLHAVASSFGVSVGAAHVDRKDIVYFEYQRSSAPVSLSLSVGSRVPILNTAAGSAILAASSAGERELIFAAAAERGGRPAIDALQRQLAQAEDEYRSDGYCRSFGSWHAEVNAIAMPYRVPASGLLMALTAAGPPYSVSKDHLEKEVAPGLRKLCQTMDSRYGR